VTMVRPLCDHGPWYANLKAPGCMRDVLEVLSVVGSGQPEKTSRIDSKASK